MDKKKNIIITSSILFVCLVIGIYVGIKFCEFRDYEAEFVIRDNVTNIYKFSEFSKNLKDTKGDSEIYEIQGTDNTVALAKASNQEKYNTIEKINNSKVGCIKETRQATLISETISSITSYENAEECISAVLSNNVEVAIISYEEASKAVKANSELVVLDTVVEKVPSILVIGGTHPNEPSGQMTAVVFLENATVERGTLYVITELNKSAYSFSQPQEATTWYYHLTTTSGHIRTFKYGSRATNTVDQWPTPDVYTHSSGQQLSSSEVRNINRAYPGSETGTYTEQIAYAVTNFVNTKGVTIVVDLHEASPEYLTINACVYHQDASQVSTKSRKYLKYDPDEPKLDISYNESPENMHGLTHRELGDFTSAYVFLFETSNASQGKLRGAFTEDLITYAKKDKFYEAAVKYDEKNGTSLIYGAPCSLDERVARHTLSVQAVIQGFNEVGTTRYVEVTQIDNYHTGGETVGQLIINNVPSYLEIYNQGVGHFLLDVE